MASPLVIDSGTGVIKAGFAGDEFPQWVFPNIIGEPKYSKVMAGGGVDGLHIGENVHKHRGMLKLSYPMEHGAIVNWDGMERLWSQIYTKASIMSEEHMVLLTETPLTSMKMKEKMAELFFETFNTPGIHFALQPVVALYASGFKTGVVLDSGEGCTHAVPVYEGYCIPHAMERIDLAGRDVTAHLQLELRRGGSRFTTTAEFEIIRTMKEQICYLALVPTKEEELAQKGTFDSVSHKLPDGQVLEVGPERFRAPEVLFNPLVVGSESPAVHEVLANCIRKCDTDVRKELYESVHLAGGSTLTQGFGDRLIHEMRRISPKDSKIKIRAPPERKYTPWLGGSILATLASFKSACVSKERYKEEGGRCLQMF